ncbi:MAG: hypothetical protein AB8G14_08890 [Ilumatobacter sp.]
MTGFRATATVPARAALAGNPSDGHGGAVVATTLRTAAATVQATRSSSFEFPGRALRTESIEDLSAAMFEQTTIGDQPLIQSGLVAMHRFMDADIEPCRFTLSSTIPRSVGLAGSSAIVIAAIRTAIELHHEASWARHLTARPDLVASIALEAERSVLGIAAGLQDRVVQAFGGTVAMDFAPQHMQREGRLLVGSYRSLGELPGAGFIAYRPETARPSGEVHAAIDATNPAFGAAMAQSATAAREAARAIERNDRAALARALDATFDARARVMRLDPAHVEMIEVARSNDAAANYTGSGGAVVVLAPDDRAHLALRHLGCMILAL